ncbi:hypothetical protein ACQZ45_19695 [Agrobacterium sp. 16-2014-1-2a]
MDRPVTVVVGDWTPTATPRNGRRLALAVEMQDSMALRLEGINDPGRRRWPTPKVQNVVQGDIYDR